MSGALVADLPKELLAQVEEKQNELIDIDEAIENVDRKIAALCADLLTERKSLEAIKETRLDAYTQGEALLLDAMESAGVKSVKTPRAHVKTRKGALSLKVDNESRVPEEFKEREWRETIDKNRLKAHLVAHPEDASSYGAHVERGPTKLTIEWLRPEETEGDDEEKF